MAALSAPRDVAVGDFNQDGKPDLAVVNEGTNNVTILLGNGNGGFTEPSGSPVSAGSIPFCVAAGDFNRDGKPDLAVANTYSDNLTIQLNTCDANPFDICLQDDSNGNLLQLNSTTGEYQFTKCGSGPVLSGTGSLIKRGGIITLQHYATDRRVLARIDGSVNKGTASIQIFSQGTTFTIMDRNTTNNTCTCP